MSEQNADLTQSIEPKQLGSMVRRMRLRDGVVEMSQNAELAGVGQSSPELLRSQWGLGINGVPNKKPVFVKVRQLYKTNDWVGSFVDLLVLFCNDGFAINGVSLSNPEVQWGQQGDTPALNPEELKMRDWIRGIGYDFRKLARDIYIERILCDNAVLFWTRNGPGLPVITVMDCEDVELCNSFGKVYLKIEHKQVTLTPAERDMLGTRYADALSGKLLIVKNGELGEYFRYLTAEKNGAGLRLPSLFQVFQDLSLRDMMKLGDWNAGWMLKNVIRLVRRGHEIKQGALAGQDIHFLKAKEALKIKKGLATNVGSFDMVTNFDLNITYSYMDAKYLDPAKYDGLKARMAAWAGPVARVMEGKGAIDPDSMKMFQVQCEAYRAEVCTLLNALLNDEEFLNGNKPPVPIQVTWSNLTFTNLKLLLEKVRMATAGGISSTRTAREDLGYSHPQESERLIAEHLKPEGITPAFEQKQGMAGKNGRPDKNTPSPEPGA